MEPGGDLPQVSVVVCTHNRSNELQESLASLARQDPDSPPFEVIVVDNGSNDDTRRVVATFEGSCSLRYARERAPGLCHARNTGWRLARGPYVAYLDDDAVACSSWVSAVVEAFQMCPEAGIVGGRVEPVWVTARPGWLSDEVARALTIVDWSPGPRVLRDAKETWLVGANMAVRADLLKRLGGFRPELDRVGRKMLSSGDVFLMKEIMRAGSEAFYYPAMAVQHAVPAARVTKRWFRRRYYWQGVSDAVMELLEHQPGPEKRRRSARRALRDLVASPGRIATLLPTDDPERFAETCWTLIAIGHALGLLGLAKVETGGPSGRAS